MARHGVCDASEVEEMMLFEALSWSVRITKDLELAEQFRRKM